jgi:hypothetical protein
MISARLVDPPSMKLLASVLRVPRVERSPRVAI